MGRSGCPPPRAACTGSRAWSLLRSDEGGQSDSRRCWAGLASRIASRPAVSFLARDLQVSRERAEHGQGVLISVLISDLALHVVLRFHLKRDEQTARILVKWEASLFDALQDIRGDEQLSPLLA